MNVTLITGADGHLGRALARHLLDKTDNLLLLFVRAMGRNEQATKRKELEGIVAHPRCGLAFGDLRSPEPFASIAPEAVTDILHCAAVTSFAASRAIAGAVNVAGTAKLLDFAESCPRLRCFGFVSTLYAAGLRDGVIEEAPLDEAARFANHYEWSKWCAEQLVLNRAALPWQIYRLASVLGDDASGTVVQQNAIHNTLRLMYYGLLSVVPGSPATRVYTVTTDFAAAAIGHLLAAGEPHRIFHVSNDGDSAMTLGQVLDVAYTAFRSDPAFARRRILKPLFCSRDSFDDLISGAALFGGAVEQSLQSVAPFAPQLFSDKDVRTDRCTRALGGLRPAAAAELLAAVAGHLIETRWGLRTPATPGRPIP